MSEELKLGVEVKDKVSDFKGITIAKCEYLNGCIAYEVQPKCGKDGKMPKAVWVDFQQLELTKKPKKEVDAKPKGLGVRRGGPADRPPSRSTPTESDEAFEGQGYHKSHD